MADFPASLQSVKQSSSPFDEGFSAELPGQISSLNQSVLSSSNQSFVSFPGDIFFSYLAPEYPVNMTESFLGVAYHSSQISAPVAEPIYLPESGKRKAADFSESSSANSTPQVSANGIKRKSYSGRGKRAKSNDKPEGKPEEVVHVRARRGQATDSHSIAERVRRGKINERLRCLQDIVPGCYKTMGMAVMLDEIINYVHSLQNQVEFLSMKLAAASSFHDFNSDCDAFEKVQRPASAEEAREVERLKRERQGALLASTQLCPFDFSFGCFPTQPFNT